MKISVGEAGNKKKSKQGATFVVAEGSGGGGRAEITEQEKGGEERNNGEEEGAGKTLVVGVRVDNQSRELLTWALVHVADTGDRVVALHVLSSSGSTAAVLAISKEFDNMLAASGGFCNLKQIDLRLKLCKGSSIRKVLVREAKAFTASKLILGVAKKSHTVGPSWISIAKHCAKKLPSNCCVLALNNGKIVFQREAAENPEAGKGSSKDSAKDARSMVRDLQSFNHMVGQEGRSGQDSCPSIASNNGSNDAGISTVEYDSSKSDASPKDCAMYSPESGPPLNKSYVDEPMTLVPVKIYKSPSRNSLSKVNKELPEARSGWFSLRNLVINRKDVSSESLKTYSIHLSMRPPHCRSSVHPDRKSVKLDKDDILSRDGEDKTNVPNLHLPSFNVKDANGKLSEVLESLKENYSSICRMFSYEELMHATSNFSPGKLIGKGGSSSVYKGCLSDGKELAAKIVKPSGDAVKEFVSEMKIVTTLQHKNIISIVGFCLDTNNLILVYDYVSRGSLEEILHGKVHKYLSWSERYKVAIGVAEALVYLHGGGCKEPIIHRDVKSSNILISDDYEPQLSDFGLAKWASATTSQLASAGAAGTFGYLAPEFFQYGKVNEKTDVYAFGVVLLELLSRRKPITTDCPKGQKSLVIWARPFLLRGEVKELLDPNLRDEYDGDQVERMGLAAFLCTMALAQARPKMSNVLKLLQGDDDVVKWARTEVADSEVVGLDEEMLNLQYNIQSHLSLALLDVEDEALSTGSINVDAVTGSSSMEDYLQCR